VCFPAQIEIFTDSENSNRTNNPRKDSNIFVVLSFTSNGKMKLFTVALILCLQADSLLGDVPQCSETNIVARDKAGDSCGWYNDNTEYCGAFDDDDFKSKERCCACKPAVIESFLNDQLADHFYGDQNRRTSKVSDGVIYLDNGSSANFKTEGVIAELLQDTLKMVDSRFSQGVNAYWTFHIRLARKNSGSKFHSYAKSLPTGIQTIKTRQPFRWMGSKVLSWSGVSEKKVIVY